MLCFCCVVGVGDASGSRSGRGRGRGRNGVLCHNHQSQKASFFRRKYASSTAPDSVTTINLKRRVFTITLKSGYAHTVWIVFATLGNITKFATFHWQNLISFCRKGNWRHHFAYITRHHSHQYHRRRHHHRQQHYQFHPHSTQQPAPSPSYAHSPPPSPDPPTRHHRHTHTHHSNTRRSIRFKFWK